MPEPNDSASTAATSVAELEPGTEVGGYTIEAKIGEGGMGVVYSAEQPRIARRVAIKVLAPAFCGDPKTVERFEQEARLVNEIRHPNIVDVFQFGELADGRSFFIMELLDGESLSTRIERGALPVREAVEILDGICDALEAAHEHGVIHRDLKSDNVFLVKTRGNQRNVKLLDFGLAKLANRGEAESTGKTRSGIAVGTPAYMSPEQARGKGVDASTDIYSLGVLAYKMLTGKLPFTADNAMDLIVQQLHAPPPAPVKLAPATPAALSRLVVQMMAKVAAERPSLADVRNVLAELRDAGEERGRARAQTESAPHRRSTTVLVGAMLFFSGVITVGTIWLARRGGDTQPPAETPPAAPAGVPAATPDPATPQPTIEFDPDPVNRAPSKPSPPQPEPTASPPSPNSTRDSARATEPDEPDEPDEPPPAAIVAKPGAILLMLERASALELDGSVVSSSTMGGRYEVSPGRHELRIEAPDRLPVTRTVDVEAGGTAIIRIVDDPSPGAPGD